VTFTELVSKYCRTTSSSHISKKYLLGMSLNLTDIWCLWKTVGSLLVETDPILVKGTVIQDLTPIYERQNSRAQAAQVSCSHLVLLLNCLGFSFSFYVSPRSSKSCSVTNVRATFTDSLSSISNHSLAFTCPRN
jgi:hypothetical protein